MNLGYHKSINIFRVTFQLLQLALVPLLLITPVIAINIVLLKALAADASSKYALTININPSNTGAVTLNPSQPEEGYLPGTIVTLTADPALSLYQFDHWSGDISAAFNEVDITMDSDKNVNAHFIGTSLKSELDQIRSDVNVQRGLDPLEDINHWFIAGEELREMVDDDLEEDIDEIVVSQEILVLLDLLEEDQDLYAILVDLYAGAVLGMYDDELAKLYIIGDVEQFDVTEEVTYAHEYTHALQDQNFDLSSLGLDSEDNSDISQAVRSLVEGDASLLEAIYYWNVFDDAQRETYNQLLAQSDSGAYDDVPQFIVQDLLFPYEAGLDFVLTVWQDGGGWQDEGGWDAVNDVYSNLPQSTEQIIHPEKYLEQDEPQAVTLPDLEVALGGTWSELDADVLGELYMRLYLEVFIDTDQATVSAEGWDGDQYVYLKDASDNKLLVISSVWDSITDADEFFDAYVDFMGEKTDSTWSLLLDDTGKKWWQNTNSSIYLSRTSENVLLVIAPDETVAEKVLTEFPGFYAPEEGSGDEQQEEIPDEGESQQDQEEEPKEEENGEAGGCSCGSARVGVSGDDLATGWGIIGLCWGSGYYLVRKAGKGKIQR